MKVEFVQGNLLHQPVEIIVNAWNRNFLPWWLLLPSGVSGAIKREAGIQPFREISKHGVMPLGSAVLTSAGRLNFRGIIHVAGINMVWFASEKSIRDSIRNAMNIVQEHQFQSIAFPIIGAGSGGMNQQKALKIIQDEFERIESSAKVIVVEYSK